MRILFLKLILSEVVDTEPTCILESPPGLYNEFEVVNLPVDVIRKASERFVRFVLRSVRQFPGAKGAAEDCLGANSKSLEIAGGA